MLGKVLMEQKEELEERGLHDKTQPENEAEPVQNETELVPVENDEELDEEYQRLLDQSQKRRRKRRFKHTVDLIRDSAVVVLILGAIVWITALAVSGTKKGDKPQKSEGASLSSSQEAAAAEDNSGSDENKLSDTDAESKKDIAVLEADLTEMLESYPGVWSLYFKDLSTDETIIINDRQIYACSIIKLFALASIYEEIEAGNIDESEFYSRIELMAVHSSNEAFNAIVWGLGKEYITGWCQEHGYEDTVQVHGLYPATNAEGLEVNKGYNMTSPSDVGRLLESIYRGECVSPLASRKMLNFLLVQEFRGKLPTGIPAGVLVANKTGETDDYSHDSVIVYTDKGDYILVVMLEAWGSAYDLDGDFGLISERVYDYIVTGE